MTPRCTPRGLARLAERFRARSRSQGGLTLVEVLMAMTIAGLVLGPVGGWMMLTLTQQAPTAGRFNDAAQSRLLNTYVTRDVSSAERLVAQGEPGLADCDGGVTGTPLLDVWFVGNERQFIVYATHENDVGSTSLYRRSCVLDDSRQLLEETEVVRDVKPDGPTPPSATCMAAGALGTSCRTVKVEVVTEGDDGAKTITVSATRRSELDPAFLDSPIPPVHIEVLSTTPRTAPDYEFGAQIEAVFTGTEVPSGLTYSWTANGTPFGGSDKTVTFTVADPGQYELEVEVSDGVSTSIAKVSRLFENRLPQIDLDSITIEPEDPELDVDSIRVSAAAIDPDSDGSSLGYSWKDPAGTEICGAASCSSVPVTSAAFVEGRNEIRLLVTDGDGGAVSVAREINVGGGTVDPGDPPTTTSDDWVFANAEYRLAETLGDDPVSATWGTTDAELDQMTGWELHRGTPGTGTLVASGPAALQFAHTFEVGDPTGAYTIRQLVGAEPPVDVQFRLNGAPVASFAATNLPGVAPYEVLFDDTSTDDRGVTSWHWEFGYPGWESDSANPRFLFPNPGTYLVSLEVSDGEGGSDKVVQTVSIGGSPAKPAPVTWLGDSVTFPQVPGASRYRLGVTHQGTNPNGSPCLTGGPVTVEPSPPLDEPRVVAIGANPCSADQVTTVTLEVQANDIWSAKSDPAVKP